jgi:hypothetical protein
VGDVIEVARGEVIDTENGVAFRQEPVREVRTQEAGGAGYKYAHS